MNDDHHDQCGHHHDHHDPTFPKTSISQVRMLLHGPTVPLTRGTSAAGKKTRRYAGHDKFIICINTIYEYEWEFKYKL